MQNNLHIESFYDLELDMLSFFNKVEILSRNEYPVCAYRTPTNIHAFM